MKSIAYVNDSKTWTRYPAISEYIFKNVRDYYEMKWAGIVKNLNGDVGKFLNVPQKK